MPGTMKVIKIKAPEEAELVSDAPIPKLRDDYILVKNVAVALNPTDWKHISFLPTKGATVGCDYAGTVEEVGSSVTAPFQKGDRICGMVHGGNAVQPEDGAFGEYLVAKGDIQMKIPDNTSFEEAATLGVGVATVGQGLYQSLGLPLPEEGKGNGEWVLVYGGSTATGTLAIQFAKLSGLKVVTTCSSHNFDLVKKLGADAVFDYKTESCAEDIRKHTNDSLKYAFDCISTAPSPTICANALSSSGGHYSSLLQVKDEDFPRKDVTNKYTLAYTVTGEMFRFGPEGNGPEFPPKKEDFEFGKMFMPMMAKLLGEGKFKVHPPTVRGEGLKGVFQGLEDLRLGKVSGEKLVYRIADTP